MPRIMVNFRVAAKSFIIHDDRLLVVKRRPNDVQKPGMWEIPGGRLEPGENPFEGLKREAKEETGLDIDVIHPLQVRHFTRDDGQTITMLIFLCKALTSNVQLSDEHTEFEWVPLERAKEKLPDFFKETVDVFNRLDLKKHL